uniref:Uncharacterized protein n=1 Tax=Leersia perrieri TaxID=77586 RepID=A0A0D9UZW6_9ORYZ
MGFTVQRTRREYVRPSSPTPPGSLHLSIIDRIVGLRHLAAPSTSSPPPPHASTSMSSPRRISRCRRQGSLRVYT